MTLEKCANRGVCGNCFVTGYKLLSINFFNALKVLRHDPEQHQSKTRKSRTMGKLIGLGRAEGSGTAYSLWTHADACKSLYSKKIP